MSDRNTMYTNAEFNALERNDRGEVINLVWEFIWMKPAQVTKLKGDDWARYEDYQEEVRYETAYYLKQSNH
jgi:hypothetical protein